MLKRHFSAFKKQSPEYKAATILFYGFIAIAIVAIILNFIAPQVLEFEIGRELPMWASETIAIVLRMIFSVLVLTALLDDWAIITLTTIAFIIPLVIVTIFKNLLWLNIISDAILFGTPLIIRLTKTPKKPLRWIIPIFYAIATIVVGIGLFYIVGSNVHILCRNVAIHGSIYLILFALIILARAKRNLWKTKTLKQKE